MPSRRSSPVHPTLNPTLNYAATGRNQATMRSALRAATGVVLPEVMR